MIKQLQDRINRYQRVRDNIASIPSVLNKVVSDNKDVIISANRDQMLLGRNSSGRTLSPSYLQDPYFKSKVQAESYARMKYALESTHLGRLWNPEQLYPDKDRNTPNLIVTGLFQDSMFIATSVDSFEIGSTYLGSKDIDRKYGGVFGLADKSKEYFYREFIKPAFIKALEK